jgi:SAM-dependent methyltransferase
MTHDSDDWEQRYQDGELGWDLGTAAPPLLRAAKTLPRSRAVVVGCGTGHEALALARLGFEVTGVDFAPSAIERARANAAQAKSPARFLQADVLQLPGSEAPWPLWVEHTCFCAIDPAQRDAYVAAAERSIAPGGHLLGLFYAHGRPGGPPFTTDRAEVERRFGPGFELVSMEVPPDSHARRKGEELLALFRRR